MEVASTLAETAAAAFTVTDNGDYFLPDSFGGFAGPLTYAVNQGFGKVEFVPQAAIKNNRQFSNSSGRPTIASIQPRTEASQTPTTRTTRWQLMLFPTPDAAYTLTGPYKILPDALLTGTNDYPWGSEAHSQTLLNSCIAAADSIVNDIENGGKMQKYLATLETSVSIDREFAATDRLTRGSDDNYGQMTIAPGSQATINGIQY